MNRNKMLHHRSRGARRSAFTLIELLLVLVILGVLAALVVPKFVGQADAAKIKAARTDISTISGALDRFELENGHYPSGDEGLQALVVNPGNLKDWHQQLDKIPNDPWGNAYVYRYPGTNNKNGFDLASMGPDGHEGGTDDIDNWSQH